MAKNYLLKEISGNCRSLHCSHEEDSGDDVPSGFESSFESNPARFVVKYSSMNIARRTSQGIKNLTRQIKPQDKTVTDFNVANSIRHENKVLA